MSWDCPECGYSNRDYLKKCVCGYEIEFADNSLKARKNGHSNGAKNLTTKVNGTNFSDSKPPPHVPGRSIFSFDGRISRSTYWAVLIPLFLLSFLLQIGVAVSADRIGFGGIAVLLFIIPAMWVALATYAKRWHDLNKSGWMLLTLFIPFVNLLIFLYLGFAPGTSGYNIYGADPRKGSNSFSNANSDNDMPVDIYGAFYQSVKLLKQGDAENALALLEGALSRTSDNEERGAIYYNIAVSHRRMGNDDLALQSLINAVQARPKLGKEAKKDSDLSEIFSSSEFRKRINEL